MKVNNIQGTPNATPNFNGMFKITDSRVNASHRTFSQQCLDKLNEIADEFRAVKCGDERVFRQLYVSPANDISMQNRLFDAKIDFSFTAGKFGDFMPKKPMGFGSPKHFRK